MTPPRLPSAKEFCEYELDGHRDGCITCQNRKLYANAVLKAEGWEELKMAAEAADSLRIDRALRRLRGEKP